MNRMLASALLPSAAPLRRAVDVETEYATRCAKRREVMQGALADLDLQVQLGVMEEDAKLVEGKQEVFAAYKADMARFEQEKDAEVLLLAQSSSGSHDATTGNAPYARRGASAEKEEEE